ncbi:TatD family hydrolase [soil metagenome]
MNLIDTHTHLYLDDFNKDIDEVIRRAEGEGVSQFLLPAIDSAVTEDMFVLERKFPGKCLAMAGLHPCSVKTNYTEELQKVQEMLEKRKFVAIGETGLDFYWDKTFTREQYESLKMQAEWAIHYDLPLVLHTRNAIQETIEVVKLYKGRGLKGVFHCFSGTIENAREIIDQNFLLGIGGVITYKNSGLAEVIKHVPMASILLETDAPYLTPVPFRGKRNESSYLIYIAKKIAEVKNMEIKEIAAQTSSNAVQLFNLPG